MTITNNRPELGEGIQALSGEGKGDEGIAKKAGKTPSVKSIEEEDERDYLIGQACVRDLKAGRTHLVSDEEMDAVLGKIRE